MVLNWKNDNFGNIAQIVVDNFESYGVRGSDRALY